VAADTLANAVTVPAEPGTAMYLRVPREDLPAREARGFMRVVCPAVMKRGDCRELY